MWVKNEDKLKKWVSEHVGNIPKQIRLTRPFNEKVDQASWIWFQEMRRTGCALDGPLVRTQAPRLRQSLGGTKEFVASPGWLTRWKERHGVKFVTIAGEKLSADVEGANEYREEFKEIRAEEGVCSHQIFNCDETGLNFRKMPTKTLSTQSSAPGLKVQKERLTVLVCSNVSGTFKLPLVVLGKSAKPRALKGITNP
ncbi:jerky protein homolog-like [Diachasma alloeum]|uniref:jerky protein homolog-like n=1 Tax=Diachasma alloeum TaxID=454923 RepID=UPI0007383DA7|nr:jerky protein homolog-like [Diachasma alloeum]